MTLPIWLVVLLALAAIVGIGVAVLAIWVMFDPPNFLPW